MPANKFLNAVLAWQLHVVVMTELSWVLSTYVRAMLESYCNDSWASSLKISILASKSSLTVSERLDTEAILPSNGGGTAVSIWSWLLCLPMRVLWAWHCAKDIFPVRTQCEVPGPPWEPVCHHQYVWPDLLDMQHGDYWNQREVMALVCKLTIHTAGMCEFGAYKVSLALQRYSPYFSFN